MAEAAMSLNTLAGRRCQEPNKVTIPTVETPSRSTVADAGNGGQAIVIELQLTSLGSQTFNISDPLTPSINNSGEALDAAAAESSIAVFDLLLSRGAKLENSFPLHAAAGSSEDSGRIPMMAHLLELGVDIDGDDSSTGPFPAFFYGTPLHDAIRYNGTKKVKFLLSKGADIPGKLHGVTALREAERYQRPEIVEMLRGMS